MSNYKIKFKTVVSSAAVAMLLTTTSCVKDLEQTPITNVSSASVYTNFANYPSLLAKLYGGLSSGGQQAGGGNADITGIDANFSQFSRILFLLQDLPTDDAVMAWNDGTVQTIHKMTWDSQSEYVAAAYYRLFTEIAFCNEFLRNTTDEKLASNNISGADLSETKYMRAEARFLRAISYYYAMDLYGNVPFVTEENIPGSTTPPKRIARADLFKYVESELLACATDLKPAKTNVYGRADQAAAWAMLAKLYLNAEVYTGAARYTDCMTYCNKVIGAGYSLESKYANLFLADNDTNNPEVIFPIYFDGKKMQSFGGSTFLVHAAVGNKMPASDFGIGGGWGGLRTTKAFVNLFGGAGTADTRGNFYTTGQTLEINDITNFGDGYAYIKYKNITSTGAEGSDGPTNGSGNYVDSDVPLIRLADVYLMYAEANLRGGGGSTATAIKYVNDIRTRAGALPVTTIDLNFILDERGRELAWEMTRRTDLIRYGKFTTASYLWPWKGGVKDGQPVGDYRNLYPIPAKDVIANSNLTQNPGY